MAVEVGLDGFDVAPPGLVTLVNQEITNREIVTVLNQATVLNQVTDIVDVDDENYVIAASDDSIAAPVLLTPVVDLLAESLSASGYVSESRVISAGGVQLAATGEYDLRPLGDAADDLEFGIWDWTAVRRTAICSP